MRKSKKGASSESDAENLSRPDAREGRKNEKKERGGRFKKSTRNACTGNRGI